MILLVLNVMNICLIAKNVISKKKKVFKRNVMNAMMDIMLIHLKHVLLVMKDTS